MQSIHSIPGPHALPFVGNLFDIDRESPVDSFVNMTDEYGGLFKVQFPTETRIFASDPSIVDELCDETRFEKYIGGGLRRIQSSAAGRGLFSADTNDPMWHRAHSILMAPFSHRSMRNYMPMMLDIADQLVSKWSRLNPGEDLDLGADMTSVTLDTIGLCGFGYRFNSLHRDTRHPFVNAFLESLDIAQASARRSEIQNRLHRREIRAVRDNQRYMKAMVQELIDQRRASGPSPQNDLLDVMIFGKDPKTGEGLPDENIIAQCLTFLVAGHETTSGLLSFAIYYLLQNPQYMARAQAQVDTVLGRTAWPSYDEVHKLTYIQQVLEETLRLWPTAPMFSRQPREDTILANRYAVPAGTGFTILIPALHRKNTALWGADADQFNPDHVSPEMKTRIPVNAYKPFGTGMRACIGRQFALQEATLILAMILQRFTLEDHLGYELKIKTALTVKPTGFRIKAHPRGLTLDRAALQPTPQANDGPTTAEICPHQRGTTHSTPLHVLYGSNLGTSETLANRFAQEASKRGYAASVGPLNDRTADLPTDGPVLIVCSSYNGFPPDNADRFHAWVSAPDTAANACAGVQFTVFGCGDTAWDATYQKVPTELDAGLARLGAKRIHPRGAGNASGDFDSDLNAWTAGLWRDFSSALGISDTPDAPAEPHLRVTSVNREQFNPIMVSYDAQPASVRVNRELVQSGSNHAQARSVRHLEIELPAGTTYNTGDHLGIVPRNSVALIRRAMNRFGLDAGAYVTIVADGPVHTHLPTDEPVPLLSVLGAAVELQDVASRQAIDVLASHATDPAEAEALRALTSNDDAAKARYVAQIQRPARSVLDLLEQYRSCDLPFGQFLELLPPLHPRYYSISSSPRLASNMASITVGVLREPNRGREGTFCGVASTDLEAKEPGSTVFAFVRSPKVAFRPPQDASVPMLLIGAGTGLAPFRGFLQDRRVQNDANVPLAPAHLFFGCRSASEFLYREELSELAEAGIVTVHPVFSREGEGQRRYVQHELAHAADTVWQVLDGGGSIFVCGNANTMAPGVRDTLMALYTERSGGSGVDAAAWLNDLRQSGRYVEDVWGATG